MNRNQKKNFLKRQNDAKRKMASNGFLYKELINFEHENKDIQKEIREIPNLKLDLITFPKEYAHSVKFDFAAILYAQLFIEMLKELRKETELQASELDLKLGYSVGYCYASFANTANRPTNRNVKTSFDIFERMSKVFPVEMGKISIEDSMKLYDLNKIIEKSLFLNGYNPDWEVIKDEYVQSSEEQKMEEKQEITELKVVTFTKGDLIIKFEEIDDKTLKIIQRLNEKLNLGIKATKEILSEEVLF